MKNLNSTYLSNIESIELRRYIPELYGKKIEIITPPMTIPFGLEKLYEKFQVKLVFHNHISNNIMRQFLNQIRDLENRLQILTNTSKYHSNIKLIKGYEPMLVLRVQNNNPDLISVLSNITNDSKVICKFELEKQWSYNNRSGTTFNLLDIEIV